MVVAARAMTALVPVAKVAMVAAASRNVRGAESCKGAASIVEDSARSLHGSEAQQGGVMGHTRTSPDRAAPPARTSVVCPLEGGDFILARFAFRGQGLPFRCSLHSRFRHRGHQPNHLAFTGAEK